MKHILLLAGAAAFAFGGPAFAKPGHGQGKGNSHAYGVAGPIGYGAGGCPPGLAKKAVPCVPPGQAKKLYNVGQRLPQSYGSPWAYNQIPDDMRTRYAFDSSSNYYYGDGYIYRVNPRTMLIQQIVAALLR